jgi:outer membrane protein assembly factor BamB
MKQVLIHGGLLLLIGLLASCASESKAITEEVSVEGSEGFPLRSLWTYQAEGDLTLPLLHTQGLLISRYDIRGTLRDIYIAVGADTGNLIWQYETDGSVGGVEHLVGVVADQLILAGNQRVEAIELKSGRRSWVSSGYNRVGAIATSDDTVFAASFNAVTALDAATGETKWRNTSMPGYSFQVLYDAQADRVVVTPETFYVLDAHTGRILSATENKGEWTPADCFRGLQIYEGRLYCETIVFDGATGELVTLTEIHTDDRYWFPPIVSGTLSMRTLAGTVAAVDIETMGLKWEYQPTARPRNKPAEVISKAVILGDYGYAIADDATLRAFDVATGKEVGWWQAPYVADWRTGLQVYVIIPALVSDGQRLYATFGDQTLYAFGPQE